ncbi:DUF4397 domain-containing protein [Granulicella arctica]|uniref:DUF4397 domain-containing protein n=1 Tax=Granulicella arctica TaxID=940613 RepID=UPI0021DFD863|nr:DUF4397 domain-containing protein [Granulicella arctica]
MPLFTTHPGQGIRYAGLLGLCLVALTGCQSFSSAGSSARVRVVDVSPDAPAVDIYQGNTGVAYNLGFGTTTSYLSLAPGPSTLTVDVAGSRQVLSTIEGSFSPEAHYTVLVSNSVANLQQVILTDRGQPTAAKASPSPSLRFIHQAGRSGPVDVYLVPAGHRLSSVTPVVTNLATGSYTGYLNIPACTCTVVMLPAGSTPSTVAMAVHSGAQTKYVGGSARTLILLDAQPSASSSVQVITTIDAEPLT